MKDYLHFYIGQWGTLKKVSEEYHLKYYEDARWALSGSLYHEIMVHGHEFILELRPLSDMSEWEADELCKITTPENRWNQIEIFEIGSEFIWFMDGSRSQGDGFDEANDLYIYFNQLNAKEFAYLLSKGFDVFGLKEKGLAIYKTDVK
jgi:hypothetical protein